MSVKQGIWGGKSAVRNYKLWSALAVSGYFPLLALAGVFRALGDNDAATAFLMVAMTSLTLSVYWRGKHQTNTLVAAAEGKLSELNAWAMVNRHALTNEVQKYKKGEAQARHEKMILWEQTRKQEQVADGLAAALLRAKAFIPEHRADILADANMALEAHDNYGARPAAAEEAPVEPVASVTRTSVYDIISVDPLVAPEGVPLDMTEDLDE